jgi:hypothetical protein
MAGEVCSMARLALSQVTNSTNLNTCYRQISPTAPSPSQPRPSISPIPTRHTSFQPKPSKLTSTITAPSLSSMTIVGTSSLAMRSANGSRPAVRPLNYFPPPPIAPRITDPLSNVPVQPKATQQNFPAPNYNISLTSAAPSLQTHVNPLPMASSVLTPSRPAQSTAKSGGMLSKDDWASFDPLS